MIPDSGILRQVILVRPFGKIEIAFADTFFSIRCAYEYLKAGVDG